MARRRKKIKHSSELGDDLQKMLINASDIMQAEMQKIAPQAAQVAAQAYEQELRATGLKRSSETGSKLKQSKKMRGRESFNESIFDVVAEVKQLKDGRMVAKGGSAGGNWMAKWWNDDVPMNTWGKPAGESLNEYSAVDAEGFIDHAHRKAKSTIDGMFQKAFQRAFGKLK
ncbi:MAG: hypothetical protein ACON5J_19025 [Rubripirellula sp.]